jgi:hypothetical protein
VAVQEPATQVPLKIDARKSDREALKVCDIVAQSGFCLLDPNYRVILSTPVYLDIPVTFDGCEWVHEAR